MSNLYHSEILSKEERIPFNVALCECDESMSGCRLRERLNVALLI